MPSQPACLAASVMRTASRVEIADDPPSSLTRPRFCSTPIRNSSAFSSTDMLYHSPVLPERMIPATPSATNVSIRRRTAGSSKLPPSVNGVTATTKQPVQSILRMIPSYRFGSALEDAVHRVGLARRAERLVHEVADRDGPRGRPGPRQFERPRLDAMRRRQDVRGRAQAVAALAAAHADARHRLE